MSKYTRMISPGQLARARAVLGVQPVERITSARARVGADIMINAGLFNMTTGATECGLKVAGTWLRKCDNVYGLAMHGKTVKIVYLANGNDAGYTDFVQCYCTLVLNGKIKIDTTAANVIKDRRGRTAVGTKPDGTLVIYVCQDGTDALTGPELARKMLDLGCNYALNMDGGGSAAYIGPDAVLDTSRKLDNFIAIDLTPAATMPTITKLLTPSVYRPGRTMTPQSITIHNTGNPGKGADSKQHATAQAGGALKSVAVHYYVDDKTTYQCLEDTWQGWHAGDSGNKNGGNYTSIGIEVCENAGIDQRKAFERAAELVRHLMDKHKIAVIKKHQDWSGKYCPHILLDGRNGLTWDWFVGLCRGAVPPKTPQPTIRQGDKGSPVQYAQTRLNAQGASLAADGIFGSKTKAAVTNFQQKSGLVRDGIIGPKTWAKLE